MLPAAVVPSVDSGLVFDQYDHCGDHNPASEPVLWTHRWTWPHWPFCPGALVNRVRYQWLLYRGHGVVGPTVGHIILWRNGLYGLIVEFGQQLALWVALCVAIVAVFFFSV